MAATVVPPWRGFIPASPLTTTILKARLEHTVDEHIKQVEPREDIGRRRAHEPMATQDREHNSIRRARAEHDRTVRPDRDGGRDHLRAVRIQRAHGAISPAATQ